MAEREPDELARRRRGRNMALLIALLGFAALVYLAAIARMGGW